MMPDVAVLLVSEFLGINTPRRVARLRDAPPSLTHEAWLATAVALAHRVPRVVLARPEQMTRPDLAAAIVVSLVPPRNWSAAGRDRDHFPTVFFALPDDATPDEVSALVADGVLPILGGASFIPPGRTRPERVTAAMLAAPIELGCVARWLPTVTLDAPTHAPELVVAGALTLADLPRPRPLPSLPPTAATESADVPNALVAALEALVKGYAYRVPALPTIRRDAERLLRDAVARKTITSFGLAVSLEGGVPTIEVHVKLPRVVREVVLRLGGV